MPGRPRLTVLSGPSGVGKGAVVAAVRRTNPEIWVSVSVTTRPRREGEVDGRDYHFVSTERYRELVATGALLEHAVYAGNGYGTPREPVEQVLTAGRPALLEIDLQGARQVRAAAPDALLVFLAPPSLEELVRRLAGRGTEDAAGQQRRMAIAQEEMAAEPEFDAVVVNDDVEEAARRLVTLILDERAP